MPKVNMILDEEERISNILKITELSNPVSTGEHLPIRPSESFNVYKIPLKYLVYNHLNDRFASKRREYFHETGEMLTATKAEHVVEIEKFLWESNVPRNKKTIEDLAKNGQLKFGVITRDGRIIDGNRRAALIKKIYESTDKEFKLVNKEDYGYFKAIVLPGNISDEEMIRLETKIQMGEDDKVDYNAIEKYLKIDKLRKSGVSYDEITQMIQSIDTPKKVEEMHSIYNLMVEYLEYIDAKESFSLLNKYEDHFINLNRVLRAIIKGTFQADWTPKKYDISILKQVAFNYIRAGHEGKDFRNLFGSIRRTGKDVGVFAVKEVWDKFLNLHDNLIENTMKQIRSKNFITVIERENAWRSHNAERLDKLFDRAQEQVKNRIINNQPKELADGALDKINQIDVSAMIYTIKNPDSDKVIRDTYQILTRIEERVKSMKESIINDYFKKNQ